VFGVVYVYVLGMYFLWVLCLTFCFSCVICLMSSMCSGSYVRGMGFQYSMCLVSQDYVFFLYCVSYATKEVCVFFMFPNLSLFSKWSSFILGMDESMFSRGYVSLLIKVTMCELLIQLCY